MTDTDWPAIRANHEKWLYHSEVYFSLAEANAACRQATVAD
jgi:hypothetical protein